MPLGSWQTEGSDAHSVDTITCRAIDFIRRHREDPFFLMVSHNSIHRPLLEDQKLIAKYSAMAGAEKEENNPVIAAMMETLDASIGRIIREVTQTGISERTLIMFFSDNGGLRKDAKQTPFREGKG